MTFKRKVLRKIFEMTLTLFIVTLLSFLLMRLSPVDPATAYAKRNSPLVTNEQIEAARAELGLDKPLHIQYLRWIGRGLTGDFGNSLYSGKPVTEELGSATLFTLKIVGISGIMIFLGVIVFGLIAYVTKDHLMGYLLKGLFIAGLAIPPFYLAVLYLDLFALRFGFMSISENSGFIRYIIPALCLSELGIALYAIMLSKNIEHEMKDEYVQYLKCRGFRDSYILLIYVLPHALQKILPSMMQMLGFFMTGAAVVESVCSLPGLGHTIVNSVIQRDSPMIHGQVLILAATFVFFNILSYVIDEWMNRGRVTV